MIARTVGTYAVTLLLISLATWTLVRSWDAGLRTTYLPITIGLFGLSVAIAVYGIWSMPVDRDDEE